jgi:hypothetical protein
MAKTSLTTTVYADQLMNFFTNFKQTIYNINYLNKLITHHADDIYSNRTVKNGYTDIITSFVNKKYIETVNNTNSNENRTDFFISSLTRNIGDWDKNCDYYSSRFPERENIPYSDSYWKTIYPSSENYYFINDNANIYNIEKKANLSKINYLNKCLDLNSDLTFMYQVDTREDPDGIVLVIRCLRRDKLYPHDDTRWISISSSIKLIPIFENAIDYKNFTNYKNINLESIILIINNLLINLETTKWSTSNNLIENIWEFSNISNIDNTRCLYSKTYTEWENQLISNLYIPNSNANSNIQMNMGLLLNDLYFYFPSLEIGELAITSYNVNGIQILSICKIDTYNNTTCVKIIDIDIAKLYEKNTIVGDTTIIGNVAFEKYDGYLLRTDTVNNSIVINGKLGINQNISNIEGFLDIAALSIDKFQTYFNKLTDITNISYNVTNDIKADVTNNGTFIISNSYLNNVVIFTVPVLNKIDVTDISFNYVPPYNILKDRKFSTESFLKIQKIVNEINRMKTEITNYYDKKEENLVMSFVELLNDTKYYYTCSLKAIIVNNIQENANDKIYFVMSFTLSQDVMIDTGYYQTYESTINSYSGLNKLINFAVLAFEMPGISDELLKGNSMGSITKYIQDSEFSDRWGTNILLFTEQLKYTDHIHKNDLGIILFSEEFPEHNLRKFSDINFTSTDTKISDNTIFMINDYKSRYSLHKNKQNFGIKYIYNHVTTVSFVNVIDFVDIKDSSIKTQYFIGGDIDLKQSLGLAVRSNGDNVFDGNVTVHDVINNTVVFDINTGENKVISMYNTGIGTEFPNTKLDVSDSGLTDIIFTIQDMAKKYFSMNINLNYIQSIELGDETYITASQIKNCITNFINVENFNSSVVQTKDDYFFFHLCPTSDNPDDFQNIYNWLYENWDNTKLTQINNENDKNSINNDINYFQNVFKHNYLFDGANGIVVVDWVFGKKICTVKIVEIKGIKYIFGNGINLGNYNIKYNNNKNISNFYEYIQNSHLYLQNIIYNLNKITSDTINNFKVADDYFNIYKSLSPPSLLTLKQIVVNFNDIDNATIGDFVFDTLEATNNVVFKNITDMNMKNKYNSLFRNIRTYYSNSEFTLIFQNDYGIINYEDTNVDFVCLFYCSNYDTTTQAVTLIFIEKQINEIIEPSVIVKGDLRITGDSYFHDQTTNTDFVSIDTHERFMGVGTNQRWVNYNNNNASKQNCIVSNNNFPVFIGERIAEVIPTRDINKKIIIDDTISQNLGLFANKTSLTARRKSDFYTIDELYDLSTLYTTTIIAGPNTESTQKYRYGADINFEILDKNQISRELGNVHMVIDSIDNNNIKAGFGISVVDTADTGDAVERELMYINNEGVLHIDKIALGPDGDILSIQKINNIKMLYINDVLITQIN